MTFGPSSSLERIGVSSFEDSGVEEVSVPDSVHELCNGCFKDCSSLHRVTFGYSSLLERIGVSCFAGTGVEKFPSPTVSVSCVTAASRGARVCAV